ncbi:MAG: hypothetical protein LBN97_09235 [Oscillospiraceae bacterium]|jgi:hypothetical protein|nr:hypothetical protein [Oscillospiraceae bacterium]
MHIASVNVVSPDGTSVPGFTQTEWKTEQIPELAPRLIPEVSFTPSLPYRSSRVYAPAAAAGSGTLLAPFLVIAAFFIAGAALGAAAALYDGTEALAGAALNFQSRTYIRRLFEFTALPLVAAFLGTGPLGTFLIPPLAAFKAFAITYSGIVFLSGAENGFAGLLLADGVQTLAVTPVFLLLAAKNLRDSYGRLCGKTPKAQKPARRLLLYALYLLIFVAAALLDTYIAAFLA